MADDDSDFSRHDGATATLVRAELDRILASDIFTRSHRLSSFLHFIVTRTLDGQGDSLKEQVIALELYGKDADFSTAADPIVRVDARRLRDKLREYYATARASGVRVEVPKGTYTPVFHIDRALAQAGAGRQSEVQRDPPGRWRWRRWPIVAAVVIVVASAAWGMSRFWIRDESQRMRLLTVAAMPGSADDPALSPNGTWIAFSWGDPAVSTNQDIWIKAVDGTAMRQITDTPDALEKWPRWSPDGQISRLHENQPGKTECHQNLGAWRN